MSRNWLVYIFLILFSPGLLAQIDSTRLPSEEVESYIEIKDYIIPSSDTAAVDLIAFPALYDEFVERGSERIFFSEELGYQKWMPIEVGNYPSILFCLRDVFLSDAETLIIRDSEGAPLEVIKQNHVSRSGFYTTSFFSGGVIYIEHLSENNEFANWSMDRIYVSEKDQTWSSQGREFGSSWPCHINVNCPEGDEWADQKRSVCQVVMILEEGVGNCSGTLINNTSMDGTPYVLSAFHCRRDFTPIFPMWRFNFLYYGQDCTNPEIEPQATVMMGCLERASRAESDFLLLEIQQEVNPFDGLFFSGWTADEDSIAEIGTMLHHPSGDIQKLSAQFDTVEVWPNAINWGSGNITPPNHHFRINLDLGTFQSGSSGASLYDNNRRVIGQLHGGNSDCDGLARASYGRLALSWEDGENPSSRVKDWLDADGTGIRSLDGFYLEIPDTVRYSVDVHIKTPDDIGMSSVLDWSHLPTNIQAEYLGDGLYRFSDILPGTSFQLQPEKQDEWTNGIDTEDLIILHNHISEAVLLEGALALEIADVNRSGDVNSEDFGILFNVFHEKSKFPRIQEPWVFFPNLIEVENINANMQFEIVGIKLGDLNLNRQVNH